MNAPLATSSRGDWFAFKGSLPCFVATEAETHAEKDAYESQAHSHNDARHRMDVQLCKQSHIRRKSMIIPATDIRNMEIPEGQSAPNMMDLITADSMKCLT